MAKQAKKAKKKLTKKASKKSAVKKAAKKSVKKTAKKTAKKTVKKSIKKSGKKSVKKSTKRPVSKAKKAPAKKTAKKSAPKKSAAIVFKSKGAKKALASTAIATTLAVPEAEVKLQAAPPKPRKPRAPKPAKTVIEMQPAEGDGAGQAGAPAATDNEQPPDLFERAPPQEDEESRPANQDDMR